MSDEIRITEIPETQLPEILGVKEARDSLSKLLHRTAEGETFYIRGPNKRDALLLGLVTFRKLQRSYREVADELARERATRRALEDERMMEALRQTPEEESYTFSEIEGMVKALAEGVVAAVGSGGGTGTPDTIYDLSTALFRTLEDRASYNQYVRDAEAVGDRELVGFFCRMRDEENMRAGEVWRLLAERAPTVVPAEEATSDIAPGTEEVRAQEAPGERTGEEEGQREDKGLIDKARDKLRGF